MNKQAKVLEEIRQNWNKQADDLINGNLLDKRGRPYNIITVNGVQYMRSDYAEKLFCNKNSMNYKHLIEQAVDTIYPTPKGTTLEGQIHRREVLRSTLTILTNQILEAEAQRVEKVYEAYPYKDSDLESFITSTATDIRSRKV